MRLSRKFRNHVGEVLQWEAPEARTAPAHATRVWRPGPRLSHRTPRTVATRTQTEEPHFCATPGWAGSGVWGGWRGGDESWDWWSTRTLPRWWPAALLTGDGSSSSWSTSRASSSRSTATTLA